MILVREKRKSEEPLHNITASMDSLFKDGSVDTFKETRESKISQ